MHWANTVHLQRTGKNISPDVATRSVEIINHKKDSLSIDGQSPRFGEIEVREYEDGEWVGGQYFKSHEEAHEHISLFLAHELEEDKDYHYTTIGLLPMSVVVRKHLKKS